MASLPDAKTVADAVSRLLRRPVTAKLTQAKPDALRMGGIYRSSPDAPYAATCSVDLGFAAFSGAALSMIPADAAKDCIKANELEEMIQDNFAEVLNVFSRLFGDQDNKRILLTDKFFPPDAVPSDVSQSVSAGSAKLDIEVDIDGYGKGLVALRLM